jgi:hypothetical protein
MELETEGFLLQKCKNLIEEKLGWGDSEDWSTQDFEKLSALIFESTQVQLSVITLKRIWGKIRYDSKPTVTTLNTLSLFLGFENWRAFKRHQAGAVNGNLHTSRSPESITSTAPQKTKIRTPWQKTILLFLSIAVVTTYLVVKSLDTTSTDGNSQQFQFSSKKIVDVGVPNTVVFDYDATAASPSDSIFIQQSWDPTLSRKVARDQKQHTSIYYKPGFFQAKLRINDRVVKEHSLFIKSDGWMALIDQRNVPVYLPIAKAYQHGYLGFTDKQIESKKVDLQPETPWLGFYNVGDLADIYTNDFIFETAVKNEYNQGSAICQHTEVHLLFEGAALIVPLSIPGCVSELRFFDLDGKKADMSAFGVDFSDWVSVRMEVRDTLGQVFVNGRKAHEFKMRMKPVKFCGMIFRFQGTGSVDFVQIKKQNGELIYEENF